MHLVPDSPAIDTLTSPTSEYAEINGSLFDAEMFRGACKIVHQDFDVKSTEYTVFRLQDFCWEDHGCSFISKFIPGLGELLEDQFTETLEMTDYS